MDGGTGGSLPSWARAAEPLVPSANIPGVIKDVRKALREIQRASDEIARLSRKRNGRDIGQQLLTLSTETRERARETSQAIKKAFASAEDGTADHAALTAVSEEFKTALLRFQQVPAARDALLSAQTPNLSAGDWASHTPNGARM
jgi:Sec-independent protein translocase protein TatA